jgi:hypothetical protein
MNKRVIVLLTLCCLWSSTNTLKIGICSSTKYYSHHAEKQALSDVGRFFLYAKGVLGYQSTVVTRKDQYERFVVRVSSFAV